jgi:hypothetical protein
MDGLGGLKSIHAPASSSGTQSHCWKCPLSHRRLAQAVQQAQQQQGSIQHFADVYRVSNVSSTPFHDPCDGK